VAPGFGFQFGVSVVDVLLILNTEFRPAAVAYLIQVASRPANVEGATHPKPGMAQNQNETRNKSGLFLLKPNAFLIFNSLTLGWGEGGLLMFFFGRFEVLCGSLSY